MSTISGLPTDAFSLDTFDRLISDTNFSGHYSYDGDNNMATLGSDSYSYNYLDRLNGSGTVHLSYDSDGSRVYESVNNANKFYVVDDRNPSGYAQVVEEFTQPSSQPALSRVYNFGLALISQQQFSTNTLLPTTESYYGYDGHGSVRFLMSTNGTVTDTYTYDAFGNLIASSGMTPNDYLYCGQQFDPNLGLYYNRARYMAPGVGRFMSMDDDEYGNNEDPLSLHKYLYCEDGPVNGMDPSGDQDTIQLEFTLDIDETLEADSDVVESGAGAQATSDIEGAETTEELEEGEQLELSFEQEEEEIEETSLRQEGKTTRGIIDQAKKLKNYAKDINVIPMPRSIIPAICNNIAAYQGANFPKGIELRRCNSELAAEHREAAIGKYLETNDRPGSGMSLDEYPFASSAQGGASSRVAAVPLWQNCVQGGIIGACYKIEKIKDGMPYFVVIIP
jgi:RHS repeat-associated protein